MAQAILLLLAGPAVKVPAAEIITQAKFPQDLIQRNPKRHDPSLAISADAIFYKMRRNQQFTLVDVRQKKDYERLHIPGALNIPLYALKTKTYLRPWPLVLVNEGCRYTDLVDECRRLRERGFNAFILDGGLPAWKRRGGVMIGDLLALQAMKTVSPRIFLREKDYLTTLVVDVSPIRSQASSRLMPYAEHLPMLNHNGDSTAGFKKLIPPNQPFQSIIIVDANGEHYATAMHFINRQGIEAFRLQGGVTGYRNYLEGLRLSSKPRAGRMKTVSHCKPCGARAEDE
jgi:hypothetical protein